MHLILAVVPGDGQNTFLRKQDLLKLLTPVMQFLQLINYYVKLKM